MAWSCLYPVIFSTAATKNHVPKNGKNAQKWQKAAKTAGWFLWCWRVFYFVYMAKQIGILRITGTIEGICFYRIGDKYYAREKSSLTGERVKSDPAFSETMRSAKLFGSASKIASVLYPQLVPGHERSRDRFREVVSMVRRELAADEHWTQMNADEIIATNDTNSHEWIACYACLFFWGLIFLFFCCWYNWLTASIKSELCS